jgi:hypothetical protein
VVFFDAMKDNETNSSIVEGGGTPGPTPEEQGPASPNTHTILLTPVQFRALLAQLAIKQGSISILAKRAKVTGQFLGQVIAGQKKPGPNVLGCLGATEELFYRVPVNIEIEPKK